ncbi:hypothetical protein THRCLA_03567 [Thraustotheca clavata]|uniref:PDZ domain-containing protein n=1 Tax=Thraustotheca clavata TaxID=74557 RepID=A0A1W0A1M8_9STRA|nr:hypothetical protein THRCLA_03567 [Thraustotheca clavata]
MWAARGPPRILRSKANAIVCTSADGAWKADVSMDTIQLRSYHQLDDYPMEKIIERPIVRPIAAAFKSPHASHLVVLTETTLEMYYCSLEHSTGIVLTFATSITLGTKGVEVTSALATNEQHVFIGTSLGRLMVFQWADLRAGGHYVAPIEVLTHRPSSPLQIEDKLSCVVSLSCSSATYVLTSLVFVCVCFENGLAILMSFSPAQLRLEEIVWLNEAEEFLMNASACQIDREASLVAIGTTASITTLIRLKHKRQIVHTDGRSGDSNVPFHPVEWNVHTTLSLSLWGYTSDDLGPVSSLAFTDDGRAISTGFALRGMAVFSTDGCKLMSTLPQQHVAKDNELLKYGVQSMQWTNGSSTLVISPRLGNNTPPPSTTEANPVDPMPYYSIVNVQLLKEKDGLCLSLAGEPRQCGAWVRSEAPFVPQPSDGQPGPAERSGAIQAGDLIVALNGQAVAHLTFDQIVAMVKDLPVDTLVILTFLRISFEKAFSLATLALQSHKFCAQHGLVLNEDQAVWEYALRLQATNGDCSVDKPSLFSFEERAKFDGWMALQGLPSSIAVHRYIKHYLSCFSSDNWQPVDAMDKLLAFHNPTSSLDNIPTALPTVVLVDFARSVLPMGKSDLHLLESTRIHTIAANCNNDPCGVLSSVSIAVPSTYANQNHPMQLLSVAESTLAVAGSRGLAIYNKKKGSWVCFGNVHEEQAFRTVAMDWWREEALVALVVEDDLLLLDVYPRNHLGSSSRCCRLVLPPTEIFYAVCVDERNVFCLSLKQMLAYSIETSGSIDQGNFSFQIAFDRSESLPLCNAMVGQAHFFAAVPRLDRRFLQKDDGNAWFAGLFGIFSIDQAQQQLLPRFIMLDTIGGLYVWDPETKSQTLLASDVSHISTWIGPQELPRPSQLMYGLYGPKGFKAWWPLFDSVDFLLSERQANPLSALRQFLLVNDPHRARRLQATPAAPVDEKTYYSILFEYGISLEIANNQGQAIEKEASPFCVMIDPVLKFNPEVELVGIHNSFGVLIGAFQDQYVGVYDIAARVQPFLHSVLTLLIVQKQSSLARKIVKVMESRLGLTTPTKELVLVTALDNCFRQIWPASVVERTLHLLQDPENEMETYCEIVANVARKVEPNRLPLLFPLAGDPSTLLQLCRQRNEVRTAANFLLCLDESVNAPVVNRTRTNSFAQFQSRSAMAFELVVDCVECDEDGLALQLIRVARGWEPEHYYHGSQQYDRYIDEQLGKYAFQMLVQYRFDKVVWLVTQTQVPLPLLFGEELGIRSENLPMIQERLQVLLSSKELSILHAAVVAAKYEQWAALMERLMKKEAL